MKKLFIAIGTLLVGACAEQSNQTSVESIADSNSKQTKPNFVFIFADDQAPNTIGAYGNKHIKTPNLDKLANQGVNFSNAYNMGAWNGAVCIASRTMINTGRAVWQANEFQANLRNSTGNDTTWSKLMEKAGYDTFMTGKWHVDAADPTKLFNTTADIRPGMPKDGWGKKGYKEQRKLLMDFTAGKSEAKSYGELMPVGYNRPLSPEDDSWSPTDPKFGGFYEGGKHWTKVVKQNAVDYIEQASKKDQPFFMYVAFNAPHDPRQAPQKYQDLYDVETMPVPANFQPLYPEKDLIGNGMSLRDAAVAPFPRTEYATKVHVKEYYALISLLDEQVGEIIEALKAAGTLDNTYIVYTADHGLAVGEHGLFGKQNMYDHSVTAPFIIWGPDMKGGQTVDADIYLQDAMATALELAGVDKPEHVFFNSIADLARGKQSESNYPAIYGSFVKFQRMVKVGDYKLIVYPKANTFKLFNLKDDPQEINNLALEPQYQAKVKELFNELVALQSNLADPLDLSKMARLLN